MTLMANNFSQIVDKVFARSLIYLRDFTVMPRLVYSDLSSEVAQRGDTINVPRPGRTETYDIVPGPTPPVDPDTTIDAVPIVLDQYKGAGISLTDREAFEIAEGSMDGQLMGPIGALAEHVNGSILAEGRRFYGMVGDPSQVPFATDLTDATAARSLLNRQKAPIVDRSLVLSPEAMGNALNLRAIQDASFRRSGEDTATSGLAGRILGFNWAEDQQVMSHTPNLVGAGALTVNGVNAAGATSLSIAKGAGADWDAKMGDIITFAGQSQQFVITADTTVVQGANTVVPISPALPAATVGGEAITVAPAHEMNLAFQRNAIYLAVRPLPPAGGVTGGHEFRQAVDPISRLAVRLEISRQYNRVFWEWSILYGVRAVEPALGVRIAGRPSF